MEGRQDNVKTHSTHFMYGKWSRSYGLRTIKILREETDYKQGTF